MTSISAGQDQEITFISGVTADGRAAEISFGTWNLDSPATYDGGPGLNYTAKFGDTLSGTGATISFHFDAASNWSTVEKDAFIGAGKLWSAVANIQLVEVASDTGAISISRRSDGIASGGMIDFTAAETGTARLGVATSARIRIDPSAESFGPLGSSFTNYGGYPYTTLVHEWGHALGLGHGGPYDSGLDIDEAPYTQFDNIAWTVMSYVSAPRSFSWGSSYSDNGLYYRNAPTTPMPLDILAMQRLYGVPANTPLSGGQTYGFNSNIGGEIGKYFDFSQNAKPIVTLWNKGLNNTLDLSGYTITSDVNLTDGSFSSAGGLVNNIAIAFGTRIDTLLLGSGNDAVRGNDNGNVIMGGGGSDSINGGEGNDHIYGAGATASPGDGPDAILGGGGSDYIQGNAGNDQLSGDAGSDRIQGGQGDDNISGGSGNDSVNGNLGNDTIDGGSGNDSLRGGQGGDSLSGGSENDIILGDLGADQLSGGAGFDILTGGADADIFRFAAGDAGLENFGPSAGLTDVITDFSDGTDRIALAIAIPASVIQIGSFTDIAAAAANAQQTLGTQGSSNVVALRVGNDSYIFYDAGPATPLEAIRLAGISSPALIGTADFT